MEGEFDLVRTIYTVCASCTFGLGIVFNAFLAWLIVTKTPAPMLIYSKILMAPCLLDIILAILTFVVQPIPVVDHGYFDVVQNGFFRNSSSVYNYTANVLWFQMLLLFVCCTTVQFMFRYYMIISDGRVPTRLKHITGAVVAALLVAHVLLHYLSDYPYDHYGEEMARLAVLVHSEIGLTEIRFSSFTLAKTPLWIFHCIVMLSIFAICYGIIVYFALGTSNYISKTYRDAGILKLADLRKNQKLREYNNEVTMALIVQAILPTVDVLELSIQTTMPIFFNQGGTINYMVYFSIPLYFIPVLNPLAAMLFIKPYRKALLKLSGLKRANSSSGTGSHAVGPAAGIGVHILDMHHQQHTNTTHRGSQPMTNNFMI